MAIRIRCSGCQKSLKARDELAGRRLKCPGCGVAVVVPELAPAGTPSISPPASSRLADEPERFEEKPRRLRGLEGLSPDYRIQLGRWFAVSQPHFGKIVGPAIGFFLLFALIYAFIVLLHFVVIGFLLDPFVIPALAIGMHIVCQRQLRGRPWTFGSFFSGFQFVWPLAGRAILLLLIPVAFALPLLVFGIIGNAAFGASDPPPVWVALSAAVMLACGCGAIYVVVRLAFFSHFLIIDRACGPIEALKGSWILSRGHFWGLVGTMLAVLACVYLAGLVTLGIGLIFATPRAVLMVNAGYLLVAGSEPLPGVEPVEPTRRRMAIPAWASAGAFAAVVVLFGVLAGLAAASSQADQRTMIERRREEDQVRSAKAFREHQLAETRERQEADRLAKESVDFFRRGGCWATTLPELAMAEATDVSPEMPTGSIDPKAMAGRSAARPVKVLVLGPRGMLKDRPPVKVGLPIVAAHGGRDVIERLDVDRMEIGPRWSAFTREFGEAIRQEEVEAAIVEITPIAVDQPFGGAASGLPDNGGLTGGAIGAAASQPLPHGTPVPFSKAILLTPQSFLRLAGG